MASFANWVDKTANLLEEWGLDQSDTVTLPVLAERPDHWMSLVWPFALWRAGMAADLTTRTPGDVSLAVVGPQAPTRLAALTVACSLDPWARSLTDLPPGVSDFSSEALSQPDAFVETPADPEGVAWVDDDRTLSRSDLRRLEPIGVRVCATPTTAWAAAGLLARAVLGGGSVVLVEPGHSDAAGIAAAERARLAS